MAETTSFTDNYQIKLIGTGQESGTWGDSTNNNLQRIEQALGGYVKIDPITRTSSFGLMTDSIAADNDNGTMTWVTTDTSSAGGAASEGRCAFVEFNGTVIGETTTILIKGGTAVATDLPERVYVVKNSMSQGDLILNCENNASLNQLTIKPDCFAFVVTCPSTRGDVTKGVNNLLEKLQIDHLVFPDVATITIADEEAASLTITNGTDTFLTFDSTTDADKIVLEVPLSATTLEIDATTLDIDATTVDIDAPTVVLANQAAAVTLKDAEVAALDIYEGASGTGSYIKANTTAGRLELGSGSGVVSVQINAATLDLTEEPMTIPMYPTSQVALDFKAGDASYLLFDSDAVELGVRRVRVGDEADADSPKRLDFEVPEITVEAQATAITMKDGEAAALVFRDSADVSFMTFDTSGEKITVGAPLDGTNLRLEGSSSVVIDSPKLDLDDQDIAVTLKSSANALKFGLDGAQQLIVFDTVASPPEVEIPSGAKLNVVGTSEFAGTMVMGEVDIGGGTIDATTIGDTTADAGTFTQVDVEAQGELRLQDSADGQYVGLKAAGTTTSYTLTMPAAVGAANKVLSTLDGSGTLEWGTPETGDITSVANVTNGGLAVTDGGGPAVTLALDLDDLAAATVNVATDSIGIIDGSGNTKKESIADLIGEIDGTGLTAAAGELSVDTSQTQIVKLGTIDTGVWEGTSITTANTDAKVESVVAGDLVNVSATTGNVTVDVDLSDLILSASDGDGEFFAVVDDANAQKKLTKANINIDGFNTAVVTSITGTGTIATGTWEGTTIATDQGGTGLTGYVAGDVIYASGTDTLAKLAKGSDADVLTLASGVPSWANPVVGDITDVTAGDNILVANPGGPAPEVSLDPALTALTSAVFTNNVAAGTFTGTTFTGALEGIIGNTLARAGSFTALDADTIDGPIGTLVPAAGTFTNLATSGSGDLTVADDMTFSAADAVLNVQDTASAALTVKSGGETFITLNSSVPKVEVGTELELSGILDANAASNFSALATFTAGVNIDGAGNIDNTVIGDNTAVAGTFTDLTAEDSLTLSSGTFTAPALTVTGLATLEDDLTFTDATPVITVNNGAAAALTVKAASDETFLTFNSSTAKIEVGTPLSASNLTLEGTSTIQVETGDVVISSETVDINIIDGLPNSLAIKTAGAEMMNFDTSDGAEVVNIPVDLEVTGDITGTLATADQSNITAVGTLADVDINGGNIDGTVIGLSSKAAGSFTTVTATGGGNNITGQIGTASQPTITSLGTLANVNIDGGEIDGTPIGANNPNSGAFTSLAIDALDNTPIGGGGASTGVFTTLATTGGNDLTLSNDLIFSADDAFMTVSDGDPAALTVKSATETFLTFDSSGKRLVVGEELVTTAGVDITGAGTINNTVIGGLTAVDGTFAALASTSFSTSALENTPIGAVTPNTGKFTDLTVTADLTFTNNVALLTVNDGQAAALKVQSVGGVDTFLTFDSSVNRVLVGTELEVDGVLDVDSTSNFSGKATFTAGVDITGVGTIDNTVIGGDTAKDGTFAGLEASTLDISSTTGVTFTNSAAKLGIRDGFATAFKIHSTGVSEDFITFNSSAPRIEFGQDLYASNLTLIGDSTIQVETGDVVLSSETVDINIIDNLPDSLAIKTTGQEMMNFDTRNGAEVVNIPVDLSVTGDIDLQGASTAGTDVMASYYQSTILGGSAGDYQALSRLGGKADTSADASFIVSDFLVRTATTSDWEDVIYRRGVTIESLYGIPATLRSWYQLDPGDETIKFGSSGANYGGFGPDGLSMAKTYVNFASGSGSGGYGIRNDGGAIQVKSSGGAWGGVYSANQQSGDGTYFEKIFGPLSSPLGAGLPATHNVEFSHGMSAEPRLVSAWLKNTSGVTTLGWAANTMVPMSAVANQVLNASFAYYLGCYATSTVVGYSFGNGLNPTVGSGQMWIAGRTDGLMSDIGNGAGGWSVVIRAWL